MSSANVTEILKDRGARYGEFLLHARICQKLKEVMKAEDSWHRDLWDDQRQALETIADKIARILNGDPDYVDNWVDIEGYARLVRCRLEESAQLKSEAPPSEGVLPKLLRISSGQSKQQSEASQ